MACATPAQCLPSRPDAANAREIEANLVAAGEQRQVTERAGEIVAVTGLSDARSFPAVVQNELRNL